MFDISFSDETITFVNTKTNKAEKLDLFDAMADVDAIRVVNGEIKGRDSASKASVSLLSKLLNNPRLDGYKGTCPINEKVPSELAMAIRDLEKEYFYPLFTKPLADKGMKPGTIEIQYQAFSKGLREGGSYANTKSRVMAYFAHIGRLPIADNGKCLTVAALDKILQNAREENPNKPEDTGIAGKLVKLSLEIEKRDDSKKKLELGDNATAIAALKSMLATYEGLYREQLERMTDLKGNPTITDMSNAAIAKAGAVATEESLTTAWNAGQLSDTQFITAMAQIGIDVELTNDNEALM